MNYSSPVKQILNHYPLDGGSDTIMVGLWLTYERYRNSKRSGA